MAENNVNKVPGVSKAFGWISLILSGLAFLGVFMILTVTVMPSYEGTSVLIHSEDVAKMGVFFLGTVLGYMLSPVGGIAGIVSLITMLTKRSRKMLWLPITGIAVAGCAFIGTVLASVYTIESL